MIETVLLSLGVLTVLTFLAVFVRIGFAMKPRARPVPPEAADRDAAELSEFVEHGFALSEIGLVWAELSACPGLRLGESWGSGVLALAVRRKLEAEGEIAIQYQAAAIDASRRVAELESENAMLREWLAVEAMNAETARLVVEDSRVDGEAADTAQGQGSSAEG